MQINLVPGAAEPLFYANRGANSLRRLASWRNRDSTRAGDFVCHYGESSGYSCGEVELTDYAPPGALCGGPCEPTWVTVKGSQCVAGDSGGPVFTGAIGFGIAKGINRNSSGSCNFYYYMSTDYLPAAVAADGRWAVYFGSDEVAALLVDPGTGSAGSLPSFTTRFFSSTWTTRGFIARASASLNTA